MGGRTKIHRGNTERADTSSAAAVRETPITRRFSTDVTPDGQTHAVGVETAPEPAEVLTGSVSGPRLGQSGYQPISL